MTQSIQPPRRPRVAAVGLASWDRIIEVDRYPAAGSYAIVRNTASLPGGTTTNSAVTLARLGAEVALASLVGDDADGHATRATLEREGVDTRWLTTVPGAVTDSATLIVSTEPPDRTIYWHQGARLVRGDRLDIAGIFAHDVVLLDVDDSPLRRFLVDLPAHTRPDVRILGTLTYLVDAGIPDAFEIALRHDVIVGNQRQLCSLTGNDDLDDANAPIQAATPGANLRTGVVTRGADGATAFTRGERWDAAAYPIEARDTTGAGDAFAGAIAYAMALRWDWPRALRFANAVAALSTRSLGAQSALPSLNEVATLLGTDRATPIRVGAH
jgi:sugar/nucleoside kinase (ribokinase family)